MKKMPIPKEEYYREVAEMLLRQQESDRGCVIFSAAMLEDELESVLRAHCLSDQTVVKKVIDPLFRGYAPLSTFAAKIQLSYAFGLIPGRVYNTLNLIRKLRNHFAHEKQSVSFQTPKYQDLLEAIFTSAESEAVNDDTYIQPDASVNDDTSIQPDASVQPSDDEPLKGMGRLTKRQFVERLAFVIVVVQTSGKLSVARDVQLAIQKAHPRLFRKRQGRGS